MAILQNLLERRPENISFQDISRQIGALRSEMERRRTSFQEITSTIKEKRQAFRSTPNIWPALGRLTSHFGVRLSPFSGLEESHKGMDIAGPVGTPIQATADGTVQMVGWSGGYGKVIVLDHGPDYSTRYGHNHQVMVKHGDRVKRNQIIALMGATGNATGPHCHYEVWFRGHAVNPRKFVKKLE
jgi:murein DD-endopeptidase MepM/ murein hydrolase activator NlpD